MVNQIHCNGLYDCPVFLLTYLLSSSCSFWNVGRRESSTWYDFRQRTLRLSSPVPFFQIFIRSVLPSLLGRIYIHTHGYAFRLWSSPHSPPYLTVRAIFQGRKNEIAFVFSYVGLRAGYVESGGRYGEKTMRCRLLARLCRWR